jgi:hypothetical protein
MVFKNKTIIVQWNLSIKDTLGTELSKDWWRLPSPTARHRNYPEKLRLAQWSYSCRKTLGISWGTEEDHNWGHRYLTIRQTQRRDWLTVPCLFWFSVFSTHDRAGYQPGKWLKKWNSKVQPRDLTLNIVEIRPKKQHASLVSAHVSPDSRGFFLLQFILFRRTLWSVNTI